MDRARPRQPGRLRLAFALLVTAVLGWVGCSSGSTPQPRATPSASVGFDVRTENAKHGDPWGFAREARVDALAGWLDTTSAAPGQQVRLYVTANAPSWRVTAFRMGWYGGVGARRVWASGDERGVRQPRPQNVFGTVSATNWTPSLTLDTTGWPPGDYLLRLDASDGTSRFVPLTLRAPSARGRIVIVNAVTTWQAYNHYDGFSLYSGPNGAFATRARVVSFDRPYDYGSGAGDFTGLERPLLALAEQLGLPLDYVTDVDLHTDPHLLDGALGVVSLGHDEYYSPQMRDALARARDAGSSVLFLGANAVYRRIRFEPSPIGPDRLEVNYKIGNEDPLNGRPDVDQRQVTANWSSPPAAEPENSLTGESYRCNPVRADLVLTGAANWLLAGSGASGGAHVPGGVGTEYDGLVPAPGNPSPVDVVAHSPLTCRGQHDFSDATWYTTPSGAGVFDAGTNSWVCLLDAVCGPGIDSPQGQHIVRAITTNLLEALAAGDAGRRHPATGKPPTGTAPPAPTER